MPQVQLVAGILLISAKQKKCEALLLCFYSLLRFLLYNVTGSPLRVTHVRMEQAGGTMEETEAGSERFTAVVKQWSTSLGSSQNGQPLVHNCAHPNLIFVTGATTS